MQKQVDKSHYDFTKYMSKSRWASLWHQLNEVIAQQPDSILELGPGAGIFKAVSIAYGFDVKTLDLDPELNPDYVASADDIPLPDSTVDVVCAFQVLEHMPFETSMNALAECCRVARKAVIISLPDVKTIWHQTLTIPRLGTFHLALPRPFFKPRPHQFDGEHYWEISKHGYALENIIQSMQQYTVSYSIKTYRVHEFPYHRFFILEKNSEEMNKDGINRKMATIHTKSNGNQRERDNGTSSSGIDN